LPADYAHLTLLCGVVLAASVLQSAAGIGFGVIAGPIMLLLLNSGAAIQLSIVLSLLIAVVLLPGLWREVDCRLLQIFLIGSGIGIPIGIAVFLTVSIKLLKLLAGLGVLLTLLMLFGRRFSMPHGQLPSEAARDLVTGIVSGLMSGSLAMPGPVPAARMAATGRSRDATRATMMALFVGSYLAAFAMQAATATVERGTLWLMLLLVPPTLAGVAVGRALATRLSGAMFNRLIAAILAATGVTLVFSALS
jgi:uncharacterized membrane protein YfcA